MNGNRIGTIGHREKLKDRMLGSGYFRPQISLKKNENDKETGKRNQPLIQSWVTVEPGRPRGTDMSRAELSACKLSFGPQFLDLWSQEVKEGWRKGAKIGRTFACPREIRKYNLKIAEVPRNIDYILFFDDESDLRKTEVVEMYEPCFTWSSRSTPQQLCAALRAPLNFSPQLSLFFQSLWRPFCFTVRACYHRQSTLSSE